MTALTAQFDVPIGVDSPRTSRRAVLAVLSAWGYVEDDWTSDVSVVVSELVTNAVQHGAGCVVIGIEASGPQVVVSVADGSAVVPRRREPDGRGGRGLVLVEALTRRWHVEEHEGGKRVRAELRAYPGTGRELP